MEMRGFHARWLTGLFLCLGLGASCGDCSAEVDDPGCNSDEDCVEGEQCLDGQCAPLETAPCTFDSDCAGGQVCVVGVCKASTRRDGGVVRPDAGGSSNGGPQGTGVLMLTPDDVVDFGSPLPDTDIPKSIIIRNEGTEGPLLIVSAGRTTGTSEEFTVTPSSTLPHALDPGEEMRLNIVYRLADGEADTGSVTIVSDAASCTFPCANPANVRVSLFSEFKGTRDLELTPSLHDFGFVERNTVSAPFSFVARNDGTQTKILTVESISLTGADAVHFHLTSPPSGPVYLSPAQTFDIPITYEPLTEGQHSVELVVRANSDNPDKTELRSVVSGRSVPTVDVSVDNLDFGNLQLNQELTRTTTVHNNSNVSVNITAGSILNAGAQGFYFPPTSQFPINIAAGSTGQVTVIFRPTGTAGPRSDTLSLSHSLSGTPIQAALTGIADPLPPPPGGPNLEIVQTFNLSGGDTYGCNADSNLNNQNMDLILEGGGGTCEKPTAISQQCPNDAFCTCNFGSQGGGEWRASVEDSPYEPYRQETIRHNQQGGDGLFYVKNRYWDDCADYWREGSEAVLQAICSTEFRYDCYPRSKFPDWYVQCGLQGDPYYGYCISETTCLNVAPYLAGGGCDYRAPATAKTVITIRDAAGTTVEEQRAFCLPFQQANQANKVLVAELIREQGFFRVGTVASGVTEISPNADCP
ncbi:MAG: choice-of-anchor D domain-containing protein [Myxococcota bacterium]